VSAFPFSRAIASSSARGDGVYAVGNIPSGFTKLLERCFCVFAKIIRISSGFEELLEILMEDLIAYVYYLGWPTKLSQFFVEILGLV
jgi:hypothetical protein